MKTAETTRLKLEAGKRYVRRDELITDPLTENPRVHESCRFYDPGLKRHYYEDGRRSPNTIHDNDLVREYGAPEPVEPECVVDEAAETTETTRRICTVSRDGTRMANVGIISRPIWTGGIYEARQRKDGVWTWRRVGSFGPTRSGIAPSDKFIAELQAVAEHPWEDDIKHGTPVDEECPA